MNETLAAPVAPVLVRRRFTADEFDRMVAAGILAEEERLELIDGEIIQMSPIGGNHVECVSRLTRTLSRQLTMSELLSVQGSMRLSDDGEPEPDFAVIRDRRYRGKLPAVADVLFVMEVADSSLAYDRYIKLPRYAAAGIAEAWLVDLKAERVERHTEPGEAGYASVVSAGRGGSLPSQRLPALVIAVDEILP